MKYERDGKRSSRASAPSFAPEETAGDFSSPKESSHITRRRPPSAPAFEVDLEELELVPALGDAAGRAGADDSSEATVIARRPRLLSVPPSLPVRAPVQPPLSLAPFDVPLTVEPPRRRSRLQTAAIGAVLAIGLGAAAGLFVPRSTAPLAARQPAAARVPEPSVPAAAPGAPSPPVNPIAAGTVPALATATASIRVPEPASPSPASSVAVPVVEVAKLPRPKVGVVTGSPGHRLWVDGALAAGWQASVPCGSHVVQVGSAGVARNVTVPCGETIFVSP